MEYGTWVIGAVAMLGCLIGWLSIRRRIARRRAAAQAKRETFGAQIRDLVCAGEYEKAAELQRKAGNTREAYTLLVRGNAHGPASVVAEELGMYAEAAGHARAVGKFQRAAFLLTCAGDYAGASRLYQRAKLHREAAEALERVPDADALAIAKLWESAAREALGDHASPEACAPQQAQQARVCAHFAAVAFERAGRATEAKRYRAMAGPAEGFEASDAAAPSAPARRPTGRYEAVSAGRQPTGRHEAISYRSASHASPARRSASHATVGAATGSGVLDALPGVGVTPTAADSSTATLAIQDPSGGRPTLTPARWTRYTLEAELSRDALSVTVGARDRVSGRRVALRFLPGAWSEQLHTVDAFDREAQQLAALDHEHIAAVHDYGFLRERPYVCTDVLGGQTLAAILGKARLRGSQGLPTELAMRIACAVVEALEHIHNAGLVHGALTPEAVFIADHGEIRLTPPQLAVTYTAAQEATVPYPPTPYVAPERVRRRAAERGGAPTTKSDLFSVGALLHEMLTGELPDIHGVMTDAQALLVPGSLEAAPPRERVLSVAAVRAYMNTDIDRLIRSCLDNRPAARPASAREVLGLLRPLAPRPLVPTSRLPTLLPSEELPALERPAAPASRPLPSPDPTPSGSVLAALPEPDRPTGPHRAIAAPSATGAPRAVPAPAPKAPSPYDSVLPQIDLAAALAAADEAHQAAKAAKPSEDTTVVVVTPEMQLDTAWLEEQLDGSWIDDASDAPLASRPASASSPDRPATRHEDPTAQLDSLPWSAPAPDPAPPLITHGLLAELAQEDFAAAPAPNSAPRRPPAPPSRRAVRPLAAAPAPAAAPRPLPSPFADAAPAPAPPAPAPSRPLAFPAISRPLSRPLTSRSLPWTLDAALRLPSENEIEAALGDDDDDVPMAPADAPPAHVDASSLPEIEVALTTDPAPDGDDDPYDIDLDEDLAGAFDSGIFFNAAAAAAPPAVFELTEDMLAADAPSGLDDSAVPFPLQPAAPEPSVFVLTEDMLTPPTSSNG